MAVNIQRGESGEPVAIEAGEAEAMALAAAGGTGMLPAEVLPGVPGARGSSEASPGVSVEEKERRWENGVWSDAPDGSVTKGRSKAASGDEGPTSRSVGPAGDPASNATPAEALGPAPWTKSTKKDTHE